MKQLSLIFSFAILLFALFPHHAVQAQGDSSQTLEQTQHMSIYPAENPVETIYHTQVYRVPNCGIPEYATQTVSYTIGFGINYDLLKDLGDSELDLGIIDLDLNFARDFVQYFVSGVPGINVGTGQSINEMTIGRNLTVPPNEIRNYEIVWQQDWAVGFIGVPIDDVREEIVGGLIGLNQWLDNVLGEEVNIEDGTQALQNELTRLRDREYLVPFRMPVGLNIDTISFSPESCA